METRVLLSTYQGERYLGAQLESIFAQQGIDVTLAVRDDGSSDRTLELLSASAAAEPRLVAFEAGINRGVIASFEMLLRQHGRCCTHVAFADQDDVWMPHKLHRAASTLATVDPATPALYCSRLTYTDRNLRPLGHSALPRRPLGLDNALVENVATGCTIVMNRAAVDLLVDKPWPDTVIMHDWWCYLVVGACGRVLYDPDPSLFYRQHGANAIGIGSTAVHRLARRVRGQLARPPGRCRQQARDLLRLHGEHMPPEARARVTRFAEAAAGQGSLAYVRRGDRAYRQSLLDDAALCTLLLLGRI
ncbi:MAG: glycosyltransferase family 2 protein [Geminicoccaceae bacterium]|nr:MAG: glycosyltransferase family 2 protein [Geminicoccaceae bacterium]